MFNVKFNREFLSAFYVSTLIVFLFIKELFISQVADFAKSIYSFFQTDVKINASSTSLYWWCLFALCLILTLLLTTIIVKPMALHINDTITPFWENGILTLLVLGFFIFLMNKTFGEQPMPVEFGSQLTRLLGNNSTFTNTAGTSNVWYEISPYLWLFAPLAFMFVRTTFKPAIKV